LDWNRPAGSIDPTDPTHFFTGSNDRNYVVVVVCFVIGRRRRRRRTVVRRRIGRAVIWAVIGWRRRRRAVVRRRRRRAVVWSVIGWRRRRTVVRRRRRRTVVFQFTREIHIAITSTTAKAGIPTTVDNEDQH
jgi:hypothetical protein